LFCVCHQQLAYCSFQSHVSVLPFASWVTLDEAGRLFRPLAPPAPSPRRSPQLSFILAKLLIQVAREAKEGHSLAPKDVPPARDVEFGALPPSLTCLALSHLQLPLSVAPRSSASSQPTSLTSRERRTFAQKDELLAREAVIGALPSSNTCLTRSLLQLLLRAAPCGSPSGVCEGGIKGRVGVLEKTFYGKLR
jgi:hypothetical protein